MIKRIAILLVLSGLLLPNPARAQGAAMITAAMEKIAVGAGVAPGPFPVGTAMWAAFAIAPLPGPPAMTSGFFGGTGIFPHSPPTVGVPTGLGVACGILAVPAGGAGAGAPGLLVGLRGHGRTESGRGSGAERRQLDQGR